MVGNYGTICKAELTFSLLGSKLMPKYMHTALRAISASYFIHSVILLLLMFFLLTGFAGSTTPSGIHVDAPNNWWEILIHSLLYSRYPGSACRLLEEFKN